MCAGRGYLEWERGVLCSEGKFEGLWICAMKQDFLLGGKGIVLGAYAEGENLS